MTHFEQCRKHVMAYADELVDAIKARRLPEGQFEGRIRSFLDQPAYWDGDKLFLLNRALERLDGHERRP